MVDGHAGVEIAEAARRMGISKDAIRRRIQRGTLTAFKSNDGRWLVLVPADTVPDGTDDVRGEQRDTTGATRGDNGFATVIAAFQEQLHVKDQQLGEKDRQISELHVLLQTSQQNEQRLLSATIPDDLPSGHPQRPEQFVDSQSPVSTPPVAPRGAEREIEGFWRRFGRILRGE